MTAHRSIRSYVIAAVALLCASLIVTGPIRPGTPPPSGDHTPAVQLTGAVDATTGPDDFLGLDTLFTNLSQISAEVPEFFSYAADTISDQFNDLAAIWGDWLNDLSLTTWIHDTIMLNAELFEWIGDFNNTVVDLVTYMGPDAPSVCNMLTDLGATMQTFLNGLPTAYWDGLHDLAIDLAQSFS